jgi:hypothetical protein
VARRSTAKEWLTALTTAFSEAAIRLTSIAAP